MNLEAVGALLGIWFFVLFILFRLSPQIHLLQLGTDKALSLGVNVPLMQWIMVLISALSAAAAVSIAGSIGFVGLLVPHILRAVVLKRLGPDQTFLLPAAGLLGGIFLVLSDMVARTIIAPSQLPVGVITALIGVPSFLFLLARLRQWSA
jgi:iron complex transport system permease protein